jgi:hypothetical protein
VLQPRRHGEVRERGQENEQVVDGERLLDEPGLEELQGAVGSEADVDEDVEQQRQRDPDERSDERLAEVDDAPAVKTPRSIASMRVMAIPKAPRERPATLIRRGHARPRHGFPAGAMRRP